MSENDDKIKDEAKAIADAAAAASDARDVKERTEAPRTAYGPKKS